MKKMFLGMITLAILVMQGAPVSANTLCSDGMIRNSYGFVGSTVIDTIEGALYCGVTGVFTFYGDGTARGSLTQACNGMVETAKGVGTFTVSGSCTATAVVDFDDGDSGTFYFTITNGGNDLMYVGAQPGVTFTGTGKKL
jgi:hypothetical protein